MRRIAGVVFGLFVGTASGQVTFTPIELPGHSITVTGLSPDGLVVTGSIGDGRAFTWSRARGFRFLAPAPGYDAAIAKAVTDDEAVVVGRSSRAVGPSQTELTGTVWGASSPPIALPDLAGGPDRCDAEDVSDDGRIIVGFGNTANGPEAVRWIDGQPEGLGDLPGGDFYSSSVAISPNGQFVVGVSVSGYHPDGRAVFEAFSWSEAAGLNGLGVPSNAFSTLPSGVGNNGVAVGYAGPLDPNTAYPTAVRWRPGQAPEMLFAGQALDVAASGKLLVGNTIAPDPVGQRAVVWDEVNGTRRLEDLLMSVGVDLGDEVLRRGTAVSGDGTTILVDGSNALNGQSFFGVVTIPRTTFCGRGDLSGPSTPGVPDGALTGSDFFEFLARFSAGDLSVDFAGPGAPATPDGSLTGADFFAFLTYFQGGCQ